MPARLLLLLLLLLQPVPPFQLLAQQRLGQVGWRDNEQTLQAMRALGPLRCLRRGRAAACARAPEQQDGCGGCMQLAMVAAGCVLLLGWERAAAAAQRAVHVHLLQGLRAGGGCALLPMSANVAAPARPLGVAKAAALRCC